MGGCSSQEAAVENPLAPPLSNSSSVPEKVEPLKSALAKRTERAEPPTSKPTQTTAVEQKHEDTTEDYSDLGYDPDMTKNDLVSYDSPDFELLFCYLWPNGFACRTAGMMTFG